MRALAPYPRGENVMRWKLTLAALAALAAAVTAVAATGPSLHEFVPNILRVRGDAAGVAASTCCATR